MNEENKGGFSTSALGLGLVTATLAERFYSPAGEYTARSTIPAKGFSPGWGPGSFLAGLVWN